MDGGNESQSAFHGVLLDRFRSLEASHEKLEEQFDILLQEKETLRRRSTDGHDITITSDDVKKNSSEVGVEDSGEMESPDPNWAYIPGRFLSGSPYRNVLDCMGHAVHITRAASGEIIYWNRPAEQLFGYRDYEALGQRDEALFVVEKHHALAERIMDRLSFGQFWSGQFPLKKRSGEIFTAMVTKSPLYEDGELAGVITVSSDAAVFNNNLCPESGRAGQDPNDPKSRGINLKKVEWKSQPLIASSVSDLASKIGRPNDRYGGQDRFSNIGEKEQNDQLDVPDAKSDQRPPRASATRPVPRNGRFPSTKKTFAGEGSENEESTSESSPPLKFAQKVFAKLHIGGIGNFSKGKDRNIQQNGFDHEASFGKQTPVEPSSPEAKQAAASSNDCSQAVTQSERSRRSDTANSGERAGTGNLPISDNEPNNMNGHCKINWEDLQLREEVGQGSFAAVYRGIWNGSDVAVKVYHGTEYNEDTLLGYSKELDIMRRLRHPNVLLFMGAVCSLEKLALVTEFLPRGSLYKSLHRNNQHLDIRRRFRMALDVARGMNYLHHRNPPIVHRDLKSSNLLVDKSWTVKVGDFGLSKLKDATFLTAKSGRGTPQWMAPEVLRNEPSTEKSDVFSFGVVLWELVTESIPWKNLNLMQVVGAVGFMDRRLDLPEKLDPKVSSVIQDCWQSKAENRPSFEDIIRRMADIIQTVTPPPPTDDGGSARKIPGL